ncbi:hypothetical protein SCLCIDRAFT_1224608, partial [Scleroderma citrinum Foug A]
MDSNKPSAWTPQMSQRSSWSCQSNQTKVATIQTRMRRCAGVGRPWEWNRHVRPGGRIEKPDGCFRRV